VIGRLMCTHLLFSCWRCL